MTLKRILNLFSISKLLISSGHSIIHIPFLLERYSIPPISKNSDTDEKFDSLFRKIFGDDRIDYASSVTFVPPKPHEDRKIKVMIIMNEK